MCARVIALDLIHLLSLYSPPFPPQHAHTISAQPVRNESNLKYESATLLLIIAICGINTIKIVHIVWLFLIKFHGVYALTLHPYDIFIRVIVLFDSGWKVELAGAAEQAIET